MSRAPQRKSIVKCTGMSVVPPKEGKEHPSILLDLIVCEDTETRAAGEEVRHYINLSDHEKSAGFAVKTMRALGMTNDNPFQPEGLGSIKAQWVEEFSTYNGNERWQGRYVNPLRINKPMEKDAHDDFLERLAAAFESEPAIEVTEDNMAPAIIQPGAIKSEGPDLDF